MLTLRMTAEQVIGHLTSARFSANTMTRRFLFRGQRDATWDVIPRVVRTPSPFEGEINTLGDQLNAEELALLRFLDAAHQAGLQIPDGFSAARAQLATYWRAGTPHYLALRLACLAQHHGMPTRMLDWSVEPLVAAYFACITDDSNIADFDLGEGAVFVLDAKGGGHDLVLHGLEDYHLNRNPSAQSGVLTGHYPTHVPLDTANTFIPLNKDPKFSDRIEKITFPRAEARSLLKRLHDLRVNGARLFPGYDGARRAERERMLWERG